jgi:glutathione S-transferase
VINTMAPPTLYGHHDSGHAYKVRLALTQARLDHTYVHIDIWQPREERPEPFRSLAPFGEVPLWVWEGRAYAQSDAILCLIAERLGVLGGESPERLAQARAWLFWEANRIGMALPQLRYAKRFASDDFPPGALQWLRSRFDLDIARLDQALGQTKAFILDQAPSIADFALCGYLFWADEAGITPPAQVQAWLERIANLPGWLPPYELLKA